jgi:hypothetical protein
MNRLPSSSATIVEIFHRDGKGRPNGVEMEVNFDDSIASSMREASGG